MSATANKRFTLYAHGGPNPWKVVLVLEELGLGDSYNLIAVNSTDGEHKRAPYTNLNPNGRMPTLIDHSNNDFVIWESGAIIYYLVEKYDIEKRISFEKFEDKAKAMQYLMFQMSGQGPYFGQAAWFTFYHSEKIPSAIDRYAKEILRVWSVLDGILADKKYLVGEKLSYADLAFIPWNNIVDSMGEGALKEHFSGWREKYPNLARWHEDLSQRPSMKVMLKKKEELLAKK